MVRKAALALCLIASPTTARAWTELPQKDGGCAFFQSFDGPGESQVTVAQSPSMYKSRIVGVIVKNDNWSLNSGDQVKDSISLTLDGVVFEGAPIAIENGFGLALDEDDFAKAMRSYPTQMVVQKGKVVISTFDLTGIFSAFATFNLCITRKRAADADQARLQRLENEPKDPFSE